MPHRQTLVLCLFFLFHSAQLSFAQKQSEQTVETDRLTFRLPAEMTVSQQGGLLTAKSGNMRIRIELPDASVKKDARLAGLDGASAIANHFARKETASLGITPADPQTIVAEGLQVAYSLSDLQIHKLCTGVILDKKGKTLLAVLQIVYFGEGQTETAIGTLRNCSANK